MGLISHGFAFGAGYLMARPDGRRRLLQLGEQMLKFSRRPEVTRRTERARDLAAEQLRAATDRARRSVGDGGAAGAGPAALAGLVPALRDRMRRREASTTSDPAGRAEGDSTDGDTAVATAAAGTAAAAGGVPVSPAPERPVPPVPPARRTGP